MTLMPLTQCCEVFAIDPKTLRHWLQRAQFALVPHPSDARIKCLTSEHVQQLAVLHGRLLAPQTAPAAPVPEVSLPPPVEKAPPAPAMSIVSSPLPQETDLLKKLSCLETRVATLSEQLAQLALLLLQERERTAESRLTQLETTIQTLVGKPASSSVLPDQEAIRVDNLRTSAPEPAQTLPPMEPPARSRMPPLIEYGAQGSYVIVSSQDGELRLEPDSPAWFAWLATVSSFRFVGKQGRFTAYREPNHGRPSRSWSAHRGIHKHHFRKWLGVTDRLSIAHLEQTAQILQANVDAI